MRRKDVAYNDSKKTIIVLFLLLALVFLLIGLIGSLLKEDEPKTVTVKETTIPAQSSQNEVTNVVVEKGEPVYEDLILNAENSFDHSGVLYSYDGGQDRFGYAAFSSVSVIPGGCFDDDTPFVEFYVKDYQTLSGTLYIKKDCESETDGSVTDSDASIIIYGDGKILKTFSGEFGIKTRAQSFNIDISNYEFVRICFNNCYIYSQGLMLPTVFIGDLVAGS